MMTFVASQVAESTGAFETIQKSFDFGGWHLLAQVINVLIVFWVLKRFAFGPIEIMLEQRRNRIAAGEEKLAEIERQLAQSEATTAAAIAKANEDALRLIAEAKSGAATFTEQKAKEAMDKAREILAQAAATAATEREQLRVDLKNEFGRLVASATAQVTGKILTPDDQQRLREEALTQIER